MKKKAGRKAGSKKRVKISGTIIPVRVTKEEKVIIETAAAGEALSVSGFCRERIMRTI